MPSRRDQLHSYQFMMQRVISSIMVHETDPEQAPLRRGVGAVFAGVMLTGLVAIGFAVYGVISGNTGDRWRSEGAIVIEKETGAHYVYTDGTLVPVLNYASARLLSGSLPQSNESSGGLLDSLSGGGKDELAPKQVAGGNLAGIPRTATVGIPGAPDSLPSAGRAVGTPWTLCSVLGEDSAGSPVTTTTLLVGSAPGAGTESFGEDGMLVRDPDDGAIYLVWHSHRYRLTGDDPGQVIQSLYGSQAQVLDTGTGWLNGLPAGQDIGPIEVTGVGDTSSSVPDWDIGDVVSHPVAEGEQYYLVLDDGLVPVTELQVLLLRGEYDVEAPQEISAADAFAAPSSDVPAPPSGEVAPPPSPPELLPVPEEGPVTLCAETTDARSPPEVSFGADLSGMEGALPTAGESSEGVRLADWVRVPPGEIAVVRVLPSETASAGSYQLVTDLGVRFPVPNEEVLGILGYSAAQAVDMPAALVQRIPAGPTLSPNAALQPAPGYGSEADAGATN